MMNEIQTIEGGQKDVSSQEKTKPSEKKYGSEILKSINKVLDVKLLFTRSMPIV